MKWSHTLALTASTLTLAAGVTASVVAATPASAATKPASAAQPHVAGLPANAPKPHAISPNTDTDIEGDYYWNGDGFTGTLDIYNEVSGAIQAVLYDNGATEYISGNWYQSSNELTLTRPLANAAGVQYYTYFLGGLTFDSYPAMFGGYYTATGTSVTRGSYLDSAL
jgi:hypothetical protein